MATLFSKPDPSFIPITAKAFRRQVLRPVDGVFLFHPRALERLVRRHLNRGLLARHIPQLTYYLIPREVFLIALEDENPDALSVIEGLDLPSWVILLPTPLPSVRVSTAPEHLLYRYWGRRFFAEMARAWQQARDDDPDQHIHTPEGFAAIIGASAASEIRSVLEQDRLIVLEQDDATVLRQFVGLMVGLRFFAPTLRAFWFPAIRKWPAVDRWIATGGLELSEPGGTQPPRLLSRSRPAGLRNDLRPGPELPLRLRYSDNDPDVSASTATPPALGQSANVERTAIEAQATPGALSPLQRFCLNSLRRPGARPRRRRWRRMAADWGGRLIGGLRYRLRPPEVDANATIVAPSALQQRIRTGAFHRLLAAAAASEQRARVARALRSVTEAEWHYRHLSVLRTGASDPVLRELTARLTSLARQLAQRCQPAWGLDTAECATVEELVRVLALEQAEHGRLPPAARLAHHLEQALDATETQFLGVRWLPWLKSLGRQPLRGPLPFQSNLKALRALDAVLTDLDRLPWSHHLTERYSAPLAVARDNMIETLRRELATPVDLAFARIGMVPETHRQRVALNKLRAELMDVIYRRYHLSFGDVRDTVARNDLRLQDLRPREYLIGDRLGQLDWYLGKGLPGVYRRGELYLKILHRLSTWLSGTRWGRLLTLYILLPFGAALIGLETIDYVRHLAARGDEAVASLTSPWSVLGWGLVNNGLFHSAVGREVLHNIGHGIAAAVTLLLSQGIRNLLDWEPIAKVLRNPAVRELSRYLLEPLAAGLLTLVPVLVVLFLLLPVDRTMIWEIFLIGFLLGTFLRNTQLGRRFLDALMVRLVLFWAQVRNTLVSGLFRLVIDFFKRLLDGFEQLLYRVEEMARYRAGEPATRVLLKAAVRPIGAALSYVVRFYVTVLVEPQVNPIKHFPVVTVSHKLILPALPALTTGMLAALDPFLPRVVSVPFVTTTVLLLPGFFGFLVWELKENWKLFDANHAPGAYPVPVGQHGETLRLMLRRGFHAGTVPKAWDKLRRLLRGALESGTPTGVKLRKYERQLLQAQSDIAALRDRELLASLRDHVASGRLRGIAAVEPGELHLATASVEMSVVLRVGDDASAESVAITLNYAVVDDRLEGGMTVIGPLQRLLEPDRQLFKEVICDFCVRCAAQCRPGDLEQVLGLGGNR